MKSISAFSQMSGGATWTTGSPRSSERQMSPRRNSSGDTKPRSSRSASSRSNVARVAWSRTSSMPQKKPGPAHVADDRAARAAMLELVVEVALEPAHVLEDRARSRRSRCS